MPTLLKLMPVVMVLCVIGCEKPIHYGEVEGVVKYKGEPLSNLKVQFLPDAEKGTTGPHSVAITDEKGYFKLLTTAPNADESKGAVVGWHRVLIEDADRKQVPQGTPQPPPRIPDKYASAATSQLNFEVKDGSQTIPIDLQ